MDKEVNGIMTFSSGKTFTYAIKAVFFSFTDESPQTSTFLLFAFN